MNFGSSFPAQLASLLMRERRQRPKPSPLDSIAVKPFVTAACTLGYHDHCTTGRPGVLSPALRLSLSPSSLSFVM